jgi:ribosomal protein S13
VRQDLEGMLEDALSISKIIVEDINEKITLASNLSLPLPIYTEEAEEINDVVQEPLLLNKIRIYELAKEIGISSRSLVNIVQELGIEAFNHMNCLDENQVILIKKNLDIYPKDKIEFNKPRLLRNNMDGNLDAVKVRQTNDRYSQISIEDLKKAHPYLAVRTLHERGYSVRDIAKMLERGQGEVSLIMNLAQKKKVCI